jgi:hypothetical protein
MKKGKKMKRTHFVSACAVMLFAACSMVAQEKPGTIAALELQKPKNGMVPQYEAGRKQKAAWHKQQNDPQPLFVWEVLTGEDTGNYVVGRLGQHWADFDKPAIPDETDLAEFQKLVGNYVDSVTAFYSSKRLSDHRSPARTSSNSPATSSSRRPRECGP